MEKVKFMRKYKIQNKKYNSRDKNLIKFVIRKNF